MATIRIPLGQEVLANLELSGGRWQQRFTSLPNELLLHQRSFPAVGADIDLIHAQPLPGNLARRVGSFGVIVYDETSGRLTRLEPRGLTEDDPFQRTIDLIAVYHAFARRLEVNDDRRITMRLNAVFLDLSLRKQEDIVRMLLLPQFGP